MQSWMLDPKQAVIDAKAALLARMPDYAERMATGSMAGRRGGRSSGRRRGCDTANRLPRVLAGAVSAGQQDRIRRRGCVVIRGVYDRDQAASWNEAIGRYIEENDYLTRAREKMGLDRYFSALASGRPQIYGLYWSRPQMAARQHETWTGRGAF